MKSKTKIPEIIFDHYIQEQWTKNEIKNVEIVVDFFQKLMNNHDFDYILEKYGTSPYLQHNRAIPNEIEGVVSYVKTMVHRFPEYSFDVKKIFADGEYVILHSHATFFSKHRGNEKKGFIITDTFKFNNGKLSEHWDSVQPIDLFSRFLILITGGDQKNENSIF